ncbi:ABC transporter ATP-binding protein [Geomicrobium sp. JCM 19055]|uniref:ABC transporter ATP-binding protein n=1 Tax=Geomicrobium sp. JCM 19055 TaxID=1460649 RepID=UPI000B0674E4|nr:ABC transporter ATP-binding protein [Geomicrobium sp. JCM 19055]
MLLKTFFTDQLIPFTSGLIKILGSLILLFIIDWRITLLLIIVVPMAFGILKPLGRKMYKISKALQDETASFQGDLGRVLSDIRLVKSSIAENIELSNGNKRINTLFTHSLSAGKIMAIISPLMTTVTLLLLVIVFGYGGTQVATGALSAGALVAVVFYMFQIISPLSQMAQFFTQFQKARGATERINFIFTEETELDHVYVSNRPYNETINEGIHFENVDFHYSSDKKILHEISFTADKGKTTAIVGPSGAGKTTIFSLIERFYSPKFGDIYYEKDSITSYNVKEWRSKIAYVSQEAPIMSGSILKKI